MYIPVIISLKYYLNLYVIVCKYVNAYNHHIILNIYVEINVIILKICWKLVYFCFNNTLIMNDRICVNSNYLMSN